MLKLLLCSSLFLVAYANNHGQEAADFNAFLDLYPKNYTTAELNNARYYFNYNSKLVQQHNMLEARNSNKYRVKINQYSDLRLVSVAARFPAAIYPARAYESLPPTTGETTEPSFDILEDNNIVVKALQQSTTCSGGWAYAAAKSVQILNALQPISTVPPVEVTAENLLDCAGPNACTTQVPQSAFDYLTKVPKTYVMADVDYPKIMPGMCKPVIGTTNSIELLQYSFAATDSILMNIVSNIGPVIVEYNPATFGFIHYSSGVYVPPSHIKSGSSHFLLVVGYGYDAKADLNYWRCLNSFGPDWGEGGFIRIVRSASQPLAKHAIFPSQLGPPVMP